MTLLEIWVSGMLTCLHLGQFGFRADLLDSLQNNFCAVLCGIYIITPEIN
jgi:hypothetical protein